MAPQKPNRLIRLQKAISIALNITSLGHFQSGCPFANQISLDATSEANAVRGKSPPLCNQLFLKLALDVAKIFPVEEHLREHNARKE